MRKAGGAENGTPTVVMQFIHVQSTLDDEVEAAAHDGECSEHTRRHAAEEEAGRQGWMLRLRDIQLLVPLFLLPTFSHR